LTRGALEALAQALYLAEPDNIEDRVRRYFNLELRGYFEKARILEDMKSFDEVDPEDLTPDPRPPSPT